MAGTESVRLKDNTKSIYWYPISAIIAALLVGGMYLGKFHEGWAEGQDVWGQFGDYLGGTLNPVVGFITILLLVQTLRQNQVALRQNEQALEDNKKELEQTRVEIKKSAGAQKEMAEQMKKQSIRDSLYRSIQLAYEDLNKTGEITILVGGTKGPLTSILRRHTGPQLKTRTSAKSGTNDGSSNLIIMEYTIILRQLRILLIEWEELAGDASLSNYFRNRLFVYTSVLAGAGAISVEDVEFYVNDATELTGV